MAKIRFKYYSQEEGSLFPSYIGEKIAQTHPVRLLSGIIDNLDLTELVHRYSEEGCHPYNPKMLLKVVLYSYMNNIYGSRKIEDMIRCHIHYMWLSGGQSPSYCTINRFRSDRMADVVENLFRQVVLVLVDLGQITLEEQYIDGTKIESVANKYTFVWRKSIERNKAKLLSKIDRVLEQIREGIAQDNALDLDTIPETIDSKRLSALIAEINTENRQRLEEDRKARKAKDKLIKQLSDHQEKLAEYEHHLEVLGDRNSYSKTDEDATFMRMKEDATNNGQTKPGYNVQIATENQYIVNMEMYPNPTDTTTMPDFIEHGKELTGVVPKAVCADSGYGSEENYEMLEQHGIEAYVKYNLFHKEQHRAYRNDPFRVENMYYNRDEDYYVCPMGQHMVMVGTSSRISDTGYRSYTKTYRAKDCSRCPLRGQCYKGKASRKEIEVNHHLNEYKARARELLMSEEGLRHRSRRPIEPESVFGQIKYDWHYRRFRHRGKGKVYMDFAILAMAFNLKKLFKRTDKTL